MKEVTKRESEELIDRWLKHDETLILGERVHVLEIFVRKLITEPKEEAE